MEGCPPGGTLFLFGRFSCGYLAALPRGRKTALTRRSGGATPWPLSGETENLTCSPSHFPIHRILALQRTIRRALICVSSKTVGGIVRFLNFLPETGSDKIGRGVPSGVLAQTRKTDLNAGPGPADKSRGVASLPYLE
jgi:hypothetical protein